jgi:hypothetical protein
MERSAAVSFTGRELTQIALALATVAEAERGFERYGLEDDAAFTVALLKVAGARRALGELKGLDLDLPPWATAVLIDRLAPASGLTLPALVVKRSGKKARRVRRRRRPARSTSAPVSAGAPRPLREEIYDGNGQSHLEEVKP